MSDDLFPTDYWDLQLELALYGGADALVKAKMDARLGVLTVEDVRRLAGKPSPPFSPVINWEPLP